LLNIVIFALLTLSVVASLTYEELPLAFSDRVQDLRFAEPVSIITSSKTNVGNATNTPVIILSTYATNPSYQITLTFFHNTVAQAPLHKSMLVA